MMNNINKLFKKPSTSSQSLFGFPRNTEHWIELLYQAPLVCMKLIIQEKNNFKSKTKREVDSDHEWKQKSERIFKFILLRRISKWKKKVVKWNAKHQWKKILMASLTHQNVLDVLETPRLIRNFCGKHKLCWRKAMLCIFILTGISGMFTRYFESHFWGISKHSPKRSSD